MRTKQLYQIKARTAKSYAPITFKVAVNDFESAQECALTAAKKIESNSTLVIETIELIAKEIFVL